MSTLGMHVAYMRYAEICEDAHAVLFPAFETAHLSDEVKQFLTAGGCSILLGESRAEYTAREMSGQRRQVETPDVISSVVDEARRYSTNVLVAVDQEFTGICRLHDLVPRLPGADELEHISETDFEEAAFGVGQAAAALGVNCFLGPLLDVLTGENPWLAGRTWTKDIERLSLLSSAFVRGVQGAGVAATAKHFPGFHRILLDPALESDARNTETAESFEPGFQPFRDVIGNGVEMVMVGPAVVEAFDPEQPASTSSTIIGKLRTEFGFQGIVMSDDLDAKAILRDRTIEQTAIDAMNAGADLLLLADVGPQIHNVASAIAAAVGSGVLAHERLGHAARRVRSLSAKYSADESGV